MEIIINMHAFLVFTILYARLKLEIACAILSNGAIEIAADEISRWSDARPAREEHPQRYWDKRKEGFAIRVIKVIYRAR